MTVSPGVAPSQPAVSRHLNVEKNYNILNLVMNTTGSLTLPPFASFCCGKMSLFHFFQLSNYQAHLWGRLKELFLYQMISVDMVVKRMSMRIGVTSGVGTKSEIQTDSMEAKQSR